MFDIKIAPDKIEQYMNTSNTLNIIVFLGVFLIVVLGTAIFFLFGDSTPGGKSVKLHIDYAKLEAISEAHPNRDKILLKIKENEQMLYDDDSHNDIGAYLAIGFDSRQLGDDNAAIAAYKEALKIDEDHLLGLNNIATSYRDIGEYKKAEEAYRALVIANPGDVAVYRNLADVYRFQYPDDDEGVLAIMESGLEVVFQPQDLVSYLATYYRDRGNTSEAIKYFEILLRISPQNKAAQAELDRLRGASR